MMNENRTRGFGILEKFLSSKRARLANRLIPTKIREGAILDLGCGPYPYFLMHTKFNVKVGIDQESTIAPTKMDGIKVLHCNFVEESALPFSDRSFDAVTMLAVIEHLDGDRLVSVLNEVYRILKPGGFLIATSPSFWTPPILFLLSRIGLLSKLEIDDHKHTYSRSELSQSIDRSDFSHCVRSMGHFEWGMNMWAKVTKADIENRS
jgi:ubiquinone/menaquinone biosynthesis C-methylase UbiE